MLRFESISRSRWTVPVFSVAMGLVLLVAASMGGNPLDGLAMFAILAVFGLGVLLAGRSETIRGLRGDGRDERFWQMDLKATAFSGMAVVLCCVAIRQSNGRWRPKGAPSPSSPLRGGLRCLALRRRSRLRVVHPEVSA